MWTKIDRVAPIVPPISVEELKKHLRVDFPDDDEIIDTMLRAASEALEAECGLSFSVADYTVTLDCFPAREFTIPHGPITEISSIEYRDTDEVLQTLAPSLYEVELRSGRLRPVTGESWPNLGDSFSPVVITYQAGYPTQIPYPIAAAIRLVAADHYRNREASIEITAQMIEIPFGVQRMIDPFRRGRFGV
tara:strand:+ start:5155 stop:5727 length:573 start_codon:yes stop_codon:yes gene_type:complete